MFDHVLLDTDVYSFLTRGDTRGEAFRKAIEGQRLCLSFATIAELYKGARIRGWGHERVAGMQADLQRYLVLGCDHELARNCGGFSRNVSSMGDGWRSSTRG